MKEYNALIHRKLNKPVHHVVINLADRKSHRRSKLLEEEVFSGFELIELKELSYENLLSSTIPEMVLMAILADINPEDKKEIVSRQITRLKELSDSPDLFSRYVNQLLILGQLRKIDEFIIKNIIDMEAFIDLTDNYLYKVAKKEWLEKSMEKGIEKGKNQFLKIAAEIKNNILTQEAIAKKYNVDVKEVSLIAQYIR